MAGRLITIEGIDGAGKTTLSSSLAAHLLDNGLEVLRLREPGGVAASERIRALLRDPEATFGARAEALLYAAARAELIEEAVTPALEAGKHVILDRFVDSSLAYQGAARGLGIEHVRAINAFATGGLTPDLTLLLRLEPSGGRERQATRGEVPDAMEQESDAFFTAVAAAYDELAAADPGRFRVIDASRPPDEVLAAALSAL